MSTNSTRAGLDLIWNALNFYREQGIPEGNPDYDEQWNDICTAMAWITEDLGENPSEGIES